MREDDLAESGYDILTKSNDAGVDCFVKQHQRIFLFAFRVTQNMRLRPCWANIEGM